MARIVKMYRSAYPVDGHKVFDAIIKKGGRYYIHYDYLQNMRRSDATTEGPFPSERAARNVILGHDSTEIDMTKEWARMGIKIITLD